MLQRKSVRNFRVTWTVRTASCMMSTSVQRVNAITHVTYVKSALLNLDGRKSSKL